MDVVEALAEQIAAAREGVDAAIVTDPETVRDSVEAEDFDAVVVTHSDDWPSPATLLDDVRDREPSIPFLLVVEDGAAGRFDDVLARPGTDLYRSDGAEGPKALGNRIDQMIDARAYRRRFGEDRPGFGTIVDNLPGMVYRAAVRDPWPMHYVGGAVEELTGYAPGEIESGDVVWGEDVIHPDDIDPVEREVLEALAEDRPFEVRYRIRTADGTIKEVWERGVGIYDGDEPVALDGFIMDASGGPGVRGG